MSAKDRSIVSSSVTSAASACAETPDFLGDLRGRGLARVKYHDLRTRRGKCKRDRPTNAAAAASHDGNFAFKQEIRKVKHVYFPFWFVSNFAEYEFRQKSVVLRRDGL